MTSKMLLIYFVKKKIILCLFSDAFFRPSHLTNGLDYEALWDNILLFLLRSFMLVKPFSLIEPIVYTPNFCFQTLRTMVSMCPAK
jgi:hypothetical protein